MKTDTAQFQQRAGFEDALLAVLGLAAGPLLWWMSHSWKSQPAASSMQTLEYWIALICGFIGVAIASVWLIFLAAGAAFVIGMKTRNAAVTHWSALFTPKFLRRILVSILGAQLALSSQAVAASEPESIPLETSDIHDHDAFMPEVEIPLITQNRTDAAAPVEHSSNTPTLEASQQASPSPAPHSESPAAAISPEPRETSQVAVTPSSRPSMEETPELVPTPRQTSTIPIELEIPSKQESTPQPQDWHNPKFTPQPTPISPHLSDPPQYSDQDVSTFVVKAGDCLWDIAHLELGADATLFQIDGRWRQWWQHNSSVIGDDPHMIQPGTVLEIPPFTD